MKNILVLGCMAMVVAVCVFTQEVVAEEAYEVEWIRQWGTTGYDKAKDIAADDIGNSFIIGYTESDLGTANWGTRRPFLNKYDPTGNLLWTEYMDTKDISLFSTVTVDDHGDVYVGGSTLDSLDGTNAGEGDSFLAKYDTTGKLLWTRQLGTNKNDGAQSVAIDQFGNVILSGVTKGSFDGLNMDNSDTFLAKFDPTGNLKWTKQVYTSVQDGAISIALDTNDNIYPNWIPPEIQSGQNNWGQTARIIQGILQ